MSLLVVVRLGFLVLLVKHVSCEALMWRKQIKSFPTEQIINSILPVRMSFMLAWLVQCETFQEIKILWLDKKLWFHCNFSLIWGREWQNPNKPPKQSRKKTGRFCGRFYSCTFFSYFSSSDTVYPLNLSIYPSTSKAQSYMQEEEKGHVFSFPPANLSVLCSITFCVHTNKKDNCFPPNLAWTQPSLNSLLGGGLDGTPAH